MPNTGSFNTGRLRSARRGLQTLFCDEARRFLDQFGEAVHELIALHEQQFQAVVQGDTDAHRFDLLIHDANERKRNAKYRYMGHLEAHGCSYGSEVLRH